MELLGRNRADCAGDRPASGCIPMLNGRGLTRSVLLYMTQNPRPARIAEWRLRVWIADLRGSRRERPGRADSDRWSGRDGTREVREVLATTGGARDRIARWA